MAGRFSKSGLGTGTVMLKLKKESGRDNCIKLRDNDLISWLI